MNRKYDIILTEFHDSTNYFLQVLTYLKENVNFQLLFAGQHFFKGIHCSYECKYKVPCLAINQILSEVCVIPLMSTPQFFCVFTGFFKTVIVTPTHTVDLFNHFYCKIYFLNYLAQRMELALRTLSGGKLMTNPRQPFFCSFLFDFHSNFCL